MPVHLENHLVCEQHLAVLGQKLQFSPIPVLKKCRKSARWKCTHRRKIHHLLGLSGTQNSCALGVPPTKIPKKSVIRNRKRFRDHVTAETRFTQAAESLMYELASAQKRPNPIFRLENLEFLSLSPQSPVEEDDQYDFLNTEMKYCDEKKMVLPYGAIPKSNEFGFHPYRIPHAWVYLFKRGFSISRPGPDPKDPKPIVYNIDYLRFFLTFSFLAFSLSLFVSFLSRLAFVTLSLLCFCFFTIFFY